MSDFSAIVLDIDGTLLNSQGRVSDANLSALRRCARDGIMLYIATARPRRLVFRPSEVSEDVTFLTEKGAFYNGAYAIDEPLGYTGHWPIPAELVREVIDYLVDVDPDLQIAIQNKEDYHSLRLPMEGIEFASWGFSREELLPFSEALQHDCSKIVAWHETRKLTDVYRYLCDRYNDRISAFLTDTDRWFQLMSSEATKENALLELLALRDIDPEEVMVFGDDTPDEGMFRTFGCSIAMANAKDSLKEIATYITRSNDDDGVAFVLDKLLEIL